MPRVDAINLLLILVQLWKKGNLAMEPLAALKMLGSSRVIWIDDKFSAKSAEQLGDLLAQQLEISKECGFDDFADLFDRMDEGDENAVFDLKERLVSLSPQELKAVELTFSTKQSGSDVFETVDLEKKHIRAVCEQLKISNEDCWSFDRAEERVEALCRAGDHHISYIVDLNDMFGARDNTRGLDILIALQSGHSKGTAFLLTHEADKNTEASKEVELRAILFGQRPDLKSTPICVIAKERLEQDESADISSGLRTAIKRAGLRRGIHEVLIRAETRIGSSFEEAMNSLLTIPPEQLDEYVVNRAVAEGVSELHVVERALTATMSESLRRLFATDPQALESGKRLRALQAVTLPTPGAPHSALNDFRRKELWEPDELVNSGFAALACGDVFEFASDEGVEDPRRFILLVQPCDVMLRPNGTRDAESGFLIPLKVKAQGGGESLKQPALPFMLEEKEWLCDFRSATSVFLRTLDLATLRADGKVRFDKEQVLPDTLLPGQQKAGKKLLARMAEAIAARPSQKNLGAHVFDSRCTLTFASTGPFKQIAQPTYVPPEVTGAANSSMNPKRGRGKDEVLSRRGSEKAMVGDVAHAARSEVLPGIREATDDRHNKFVAYPVRPPEVMGPTSVRKEDSVATQIREASPILSDELPIISIAELSSISNPVGTDIGGMKDAKIEPDGVDSTAKALPVAPQVPYFTWYIRRCGRVRMPFAASLLNDYLSIMGRDAFDLDYLKAIPVECQEDISIQPTHGSVVANVAQA